VSKKIKCPKCGCGEGYDCDANNRFVKHTCDCRYEREHALRLDAEADSRELRSMLRKLLSELDLYIRSRKQRWINDRNPMGGGGDEVA
jgi:hypothetical protein